MTILTEENLKHLEGLAVAASQGEWNLGVSTTETIEEAQEWVHKCVAWSTEPKLHIVYAGPVDDDQTMVVALTGNGPTSEANARYIGHVEPRTVLMLIADIRELRAALETRTTTDGQR